MKSSAEYHRLELSPTRQASQDDESSHSYQPRDSPRSSKKTKIFLVVALTISVLLNLSTFFSHRHTETTLPEIKTRFAGLVFNTPSSFIHHGPYDSRNKTVSAETWNNLNYDLGSIALDYEYAASLGLPKAQEHPWDKNKGLYFLNGFHSLHCLKIIHTTMEELNNPNPSHKPLSFPYGHSLHCLEALVQDTMCFADDTPRFTSFEHPGRPGDGQSRVCRDWIKLEEYAKEHWSCWKDIKPTEDIDTLLRYRYCPKGSPYYEKIKQIFGEGPFEES